MLPELGKVDREAGEFWVANPFLMPTSGKNLSAYERNRLFLNLKGKDFIDASFASAVDIDADSRSAIPADYDNDGAVDLLVGSVGVGPLRLFKNQLPVQNFIHITLLDNQRPAIGSRVELRCGNQTIVRDLFAANGFMGQSPADLHIGVGQATQIDNIKILWATKGGSVQEFKNVHVNQRIAIKRQQPQIEVLTVGQPRN